MTRPEFNYVMMSIAEVISSMSTCSSRIAVGAILVKDKRIVASGYNGAPIGLPHCDTVGCTFDEKGSCTRSLHAEENIIIQCALHGVSMIGCTLYTTHFPCERCALKLINTKISTVVYKTPYKDMSGMELLKDRIRVVQLSYVYQMTLGI